MNYPDEFNKIPLITKNIKKVYSDIEYDKTHPKIRMLSDMATNSFTEQLISKYLVNFIDFLYNAINSNILLNINDTLIKNKFEKISDEQVFLYFKGGNNFVLLDKIFNRTKEHENIDINNIPKSINDFIKISDNDFSITIIAKNETRFTEIYYCTKILLTNALYDISNSFNMMYYNEIIMGQYSKNNGGDSYPNPPITSNEITNEYVDIKNDLGYYEKYNTCTFFYATFYPFNNNYSKANELNEISKKYDTCTNIYMLTVLEYLRSLYPNYVQNRNIINKINKLLLNKQFFFYNKIYKNNMDGLFESLAKELNKTNLETIYYKQLSPVNERYKIVRKVEQSDLKVTNKVNNLIINTNTLDDPIGMTIIDHNPYPQNPQYVNCNYMTINATVFNNLVTSSHIVDFDLFRLKFDITMTVSERPLVQKITDKTSEWRNVLFNIPSEFVDVSVTKYDDINNSTSTQDYYKDPVGFIVTHLYEYHSLDSTFVMLGYKLITDDLVYTLFKSSSYTPFYVAKYNKRIVRLFYFYSLSILTDVSKGALCRHLTNFKNEFGKVVSSLSNNLTGNTVNKQNINTISNTFKSTFYDHDVTFDNIKFINDGFLIHNLINVKKEYKLLQPLLNLILVYILILENDYTYLLEFTDKYNKMYNIIISEDYDNIYLNFYKFVNECLNNINVCNNTFCLTNPEPDNPIFKNMMTDNEGNKIIYVDNGSYVEYNFIDKDNNSYTIKVNKKHESTVTSQDTTCSKKCSNQYTDEMYCCSEIADKYNQLINDVNNMDNSNPDKPKMTEILKKFLKSRGY